MVYKPCFYAILFLPFSLPLQALSPIVEAKQEIEQFRRQARSNNLSFHKGEALSALVAHFQDPRKYTHAKEILSIEQQAELLEVADRCDTALTIPNQEVRNQEIAASLRSLDEVVGGIFYASFGGARKIARVSAKRGTKQVPKNSQPSRSIPSGNEDREELLNRMMHNHPQNSFLSYLSANKWSILFGIAALYAIIARAQDWPPFDQEDDVPEGHEPARDGNNAADQQPAHN